MGSSIKVVAGLLCLGLAGCDVQTPGHPTARQGAPTAYGVVYQQGDQAGAQWFQLESGNARFVVSSANPFALVKASLALEGSRASRSPLVVRFDPEGGAIDPASATPSFMATSLWYQGQEIDLGSARPGVRPVGGDSPSAKALARGVGWALAGEPSRARADLNQAIAEPTLSPPFKADAYGVLGSLDLREVADQDAGPTPEADRDLIDALGAFRAAQTQNHQDIEWALGAAESLYLLGAYDEALRDYDAIGSRWPKQPYWSAIGKAIVYRLLGRNQESLAALDQLARDHGPQQGMAFHYHRGLTLLQMGRDSEAADEFTSGLAFQPDYEWAYSRRACAFGRLGRIQEALADARKAQDIFATRSAQEHTSPRQTHDLAWMARVEAELAAAARTAKPAHVDAACQGFWNSAFEKRDRSALLTDQAAAAPPESTTPATG